MVAEEEEVRSVLCKCRNGGEISQFLLNAVCVRERELLYRDEGWKDEEIE